MKIFTILTSVQENKRLSKVVNISVGRQRFGCPRAVEIWNRFLWVVTKGSGVGAEWDNLWTIDYSGLGYSTPLKHLLLKFSLGYLGLRSASFFFFSKSLPHTHTLIIWWCGSFHFVMSGTFFGIILLFFIIISLVLSKILQQHVLFCFWACCTKQHCIRHIFELVVFKYLQDVKVILYTLFTPSSQ